MGGLGWIGMLLFWAALIFLIVVGVRWVLQRERTQGPAESPLDILKKRYARGEISKEEFERMKRDLE